MRPTLLLIVAVSAVAASCGPSPIVCDAEGMIVLPVDKMGKDWGERHARNMALAQRRLDTAVGMPRRAGEEYASLAKAEGCP